MGNYFIIEAYPENKFQAEELDQLLQETLAGEGVRGSVIISWVMADTLERIGITKLPAIVIGEQVVLQGRIPTRADVVSWLDRLVPQDKRAPKRDPRHTGWPSSLGEAATWLIEGMTEKEKLEIAAANDEDLSLANGWPGGWGQGIRNGYGLWAGNTALLHSCGTSDADEASLLIIMEVREQLKKFEEK